MRSELFLVAIEQRINIDIATIPFDDVDPFSSIEDLLDRPSPQIDSLLVSPLHFEAASAIARAYPDLIVVALGGQSRNAPANLIAPQTDRLPALAEALEAIDSYIATKRVVGVPEEIEAGAQSSDDAIAEDAQSAIEDAAEANSEEEPRIDVIILTLRGALSQQNENNFLQEQVSQYSWDFTIQEMEPATIFADIPRTIDDIVAKNPYVLGVLLGSATDEALTRIGSNFDGLLLLENAGIHR